MAYNVLVVDDSSVMRAMIIKTLHISGLPVGDVHEASNGIEGLATLNANWIDLVIIDINMPEMNGEEMIDRMRQQPATKDTPTIVISTEGSDTRIERIQGKVSSFIQKPFSPESIRDAIQNVIGKEAEGNV